MSGMGGYNDTRLGSGYYSVTFAGNGYTSKARTQELALLRACELAYADGYKKFELIGANTNIRIDTTVTPGVSTTSGSGYLTGSGYNYNSTTITTPPMEIALQKPDSSVSLKGLPATSKKGEDLQTTIVTIKQKYSIKS